MLPQKVQPDAETASIKKHMWHTLRILRSNPGMALVATLSLGLGIGVNTTLYSVVHTVFLQPPTAGAPDRLVRIETGNSNQISYLNYRDLRPDEAFEGFAAYAMTRLNLRAGNDVERVSGMLVTPSFFELLGVRPQVGRGFAQGEERAAIVTHNFARKHSHSLGAVLNLNGHAFTVVGILSEEYRPVTGSFGPDVYVPVSEATAPALNKRSHAFLTMLGRLRSGASTHQAQAVIMGQARALERMYPNENVDLGRAIHLFPIAGLGSWRTRDMPMFAVVAIAAVPFVIFGLVLLIACANVAGLLLARGAARRREIAIRLAIGAPRSRIVGSLLGECLVLSALGSAAGLLLTYWLCGLVSLVALPQAPGPLRVSPDLSVLLYALFLAFVTTLMCGLTPALASTKPHLVESLKQDTGLSGGRLSARRALVIGQVALSTLLLFVSTLFLRSLTFIGSVDPGFDIEHVVTARIELDRERYPEEQRLGFATQAAEAVRNIPGVVSASIASLIPLAGDSYSTVYEVEGKTVKRSHSYLMHAGPGYFHTMGIRLHVGREFTEADRAGAPPVAIVNEAFVRAHGLGTSPLGAHVRNGERKPWLRIDGVVADSKYGFFGETPQPVVYLPYQQAGGSLIVVARAASPAAIILEVRRAILELDKSAMVDARSMRDATTLEFTLRRMGTWLLGMIGALGLALALVGLYGVMAYTVNRRIPELGIRMALGASRPAILWMILRSGLGQVAAGLILGTAISLAAARPLAFLMSGIGTTDPWTIAITSGTLLLAGMAASYFPARRAARVDPMIMLRYR
jgi:predicted permease